MWFLIGETIVMALLAAYLHVVLPSEFGVRRSPLFFLEPIKKMFARDKKKEKGHVEGDDDDENRALIDIPLYVT